jgi:hypothetical protein
MQPQPIIRQPHRHIRFRVSLKLDMQNISLPFQQHHTIGPDWFERQVLSKLIGLF